MKERFVQFEDNHSNSVGTDGTDCTNGQWDFIKHCLLAAEEEIIGYHE